DWSSDVCSSDLARPGAAGLGRARSGADRVRRALAGRRDDPVLVPADQPGRHRPRLERLRQLREAVRREGLRGHHDPQRDLGGGRRRPHRADLARPRPAVQPALPRPQSRPVGPHRALGRVRAADRHRLPVDARPRGRHHQPAQAQTRAHRRARRHRRRPARRRLHRHAVAGVRRGLRLHPLHHVRAARRTRHHPGRRVRSSQDGRSLPAAHLLVDHAAAAATRADRGRADQHDERLQQLPDHLGHDARPARILDGHLDDLHVHPQGLRHRRIRRHVGGQLRNGARDHRGLPQDLELEQGGVVMAVETAPKAPARPSHARPAPAGHSGMPRLKTTVTAAVAYVIAFIFLFPYLVMLLTSLRPQETLRDATILPTQWECSNLVNFWSSGLAGNLVVTLQVAAGSTVLVLLVALPAAYYAARHNFRGRTFFLILVLITQMFQPTAMLVGIYREFSQLGLVDSVWSLILVNGGFNLAFAVWILTAYFSSIPRELEEAAFIDGNGRFGALFRITLPLAMPGVIT